jgi:hypothetical protein
MRTDLHHRHVPHKEVSMRWEAKAGHHLPSDLPSLVSSSTSGSLVRFSLRSDLRDWGRGMRP